jgi:hypothetical protein
MQVWWQLFFFFFLRQLPLPTGQMPIQAVSLTNLQLALFLNYLTLKSV